MATHTISSTGHGRWRRAAIVASLTAALVSGVVGVPGAFAAPNPEPTTSADAKTAWDASAHQAEIASEQLAGAKISQTKAATAAVTAATALTTARAAVVAAQKKETSAEVTVAGYQGRLDTFANASLRGVRLGEMSALLTADSADDFLDKASSIDQVAADTQSLLTQAITSRYSAQAAKAAADTAETTAELAKTNADTANVAAVSAAATALTRKSDLDTAVSKYKTLYGALSEQERAAAAAAAAQARAESLARARAAEEAAEAAAASSSSSSASSSLAAAAAANAAAAPPANPAAPAPTSDSSGSSSSSSSSSTSSSSTAVQAAAAAPAPGGGGDSAGETAAQAAMTKIGGGYCYACDGPDSFDCSGLTTWAWAQAGISIPRVSYEQANFPEVPLDQLQPGDLVTYYSPVSHVAIYVGNGMVVSAADEELGILYVPVDRAGPDPTGHRVPRG